MNVTVGDPVAFTGLAAGEYNATVYYSGDANYNASSSSAKFLVSKNASSVSVTPEDIFVGMTENVVVVVTPSGAVGTSLMRMVLLLRLLKKKSLQMVLSLYLLKIYQRAIIKSL